MTGRPALDPRPAEQLDRDAVILERLHAAGLPIRTPIGAGYQRSWDQHVREQETEIIRAGLRMSGTRARNRARYSTQALACAASPS